MPGCLRLGHVQRQLMLAMVALSLRFVDAQEISQGSCQNFPVVTQFDLGRYSGRWYGYSNYFALFEAYSDCANSDYIDATQMGGIPVIRVINRSINRLTGEQGEAKGYAVPNNPMDPTRPAQLVVNFETTPPLAIATSTNYNVVDTDYDSYAIVYTCKEMAGQLKSELLWVLTRQREPSKELIDQVYRKIELAGLDTGRLQLMKQVNCPIFV